MELGDHPGKALPVRQQAQGRTSSSRCSGRDSRWRNSSGAGAAPEQRHGGVVRAAMCDVEALDRARGRRARHPADARRPGREGHGRDHFARGGATGAQIDVPRHGRLDRALCVARVWGIMTSFQAIAATRTRASRWWRRALPLSRPRWVCSPPFLP